MQFGSNYLETINSADMNKEHKSSSSHMSSHLDLMNSHDGKTTSTALRSQSVLKAPSLN